MTGAARPRAEREAIEWEVRLRGAAPDDDALRAFRAWRARAPEHAAAWDALQERLGRMGRGGRDACLVAQALRTPDGERRRALRAGFGTALLALAGFGGWRGAHALGLDADWRSGTGERGAARLADGSPLRFDAASRIDLAGTPGRPRLVLRQGQLLVDARAPLAVCAGGWVAETDGGRLAVGRIGRRLVVAASGGTARLRGPDGSDIALDGGRALQVEQGVPAPSALSFGAAGAWTRGMLVADRLPLPDLADALGRYHAGVIRVDGAAAQRVVSGVFALARLDDTLRQLAAALPVRVQRHAGIVTRIT